MSGFEDPLDMKLRSDIKDPKEALEKLIVFFIGAKLLKAFIYDTKIQTIRHETGS